MAGWIKEMRYVCVLSRFSRAWLFATWWTVAYQAPLSMGFSRQQYWSGFQCPPPGDLPDPGVEPTFLKSPPLAGGFFSTSTTSEAIYIYTHIHIHNGKSFNKKEGNPALCDNMDEAGGHVAKWNKQRMQILHDLIYTWNLKKSIS